MHNVFCVKCDRTVQFHTPPSHNAIMARRRHFYNHRRPEYDSGEYERLNRIADSHKKVFREWAVAYKSTCSDILGNQTCAYWEWIRTSNGRGRPMGSCTVYGRLVRDKVFMIRRLEGVEVKFQKLPMNAIGVFWGSSQLAAEPCQLLPGCYDLIE